MNVHEEFAEDLALYALGSLEGDERLALEFQKRLLQRGAELHARPEDRAGCTHDIAIRQTQGFASCVGYADKIWTFS